MNTPQNQTLKDFERFFQEGYAEAKPPELQEASLAIYRALLKGSAVDLNIIAKDLKLSRGKLDQVLALLPKSTIDFDENGKIVAFVGFSLIPANHQFFAGGKEFYTWCVFDALFLPSLLQTGARLVTKCPETDEKIEVYLSDQTVLSASPAAPVLSLVATTGDACCHDIRGAFCNHVNLFKDQATFDTWSKGKDRTLAVPLKKGFAMALQRNEWRYPDIDWKAPFCSSENEEEQRNG